jgi:hypothetical protein
VFSNTQDDLAGLERELSTRFDDYRVDVVGAVALFSALVPA